MTCAHLSAPFQELLGAAVTLLRLTGAVLLFSPTANIRLQGDLQVLSQYAKSST